MINRTIEQRYKKLSQREHVLEKSGMYIGNINTELKDMFIVEDVDNLDNIKIINKLIKYNAGFLKIFDEILSNASDHSIRTGEVKYIKVNVFSDHIIIENDGPGIPIVVHKEHGIYIPEMLFGNLLTGENYQKDDDRLVAGTNGIGSKATNIFSKRFLVETSDGKKQYNQEFSNNLIDIAKPKITKSNKNYTKITYFPDFEKFGLESIDKDIEKLFLKRVIDIAAYCPKLNVYYNDKLIKIKSFKDYMSYFVEKDTEMFYERLNDNWEIGIVPSTNDNFQQSSLVNGTNCYIGGTHVNFIANKLIGQITETLAKKNKKISIKPNDIKNKLFIFVNCKIVNPVFDSQTKENLSTKITNAISGNAEISDKLIKQISQSSIVEDILNYIELREKAELKKLGKGKTSKVKIKKLDDANMAGTRNSDKCILFLAEGDCLEENMEITIIRNGEKITILMKDIMINDAVITHENNIGVVNSISKKIEKCVNIKLKNGQILMCSEKHRWYVYDKIDDKFIFLETKNIDKLRHKMIINKNVYFDDFVKILDIDKIENDKYDYLLTLSTGEMYSSKTHRFSVFDKEEYRFDMIETQYLDKNKHFIVSYEKI